MSKCEQLRNEMSVWDLAFGIPSRFCLLSLSSTPWHVPCSAYECNGTGCKCKLTFPTLFFWKIHPIFSEKYLQKEMQKMTKEEITCKQLCSI